jgi:hypothetical protein
MGGDESVNPEYISQFKKQRNEIRNRRTSRSNHNLSMDEEDGPEGDGMTEPENGTNISSHS